MSLKKFIQVFVLFTVVDSAFAATCTTSNNTCVATTNTLATCSNSECACRTADFLPIRTGCGKKFATPSVNVEDGYSKEILSGKSGVLTCTSSNTGTDFEWTLNGTVISGATGSTYTITSANPANVGPYKCKAKAGSSSKLDSDYSPEITLKLINTTDSISAPILTKSPEKLFAGKTVTFKCGQIPIGYNTAKIVYQFDNGTITTSSFAITGIDTKVNCSLTDSSAHINTVVSNAVAVPDIVTDITAVSVENAVDNANYTTDATISLKCVPTPDVAYIDKALTYVWMNNSAVISGANSQTYDLPKIDGTYTISCNATYPAGATKTSSVLTIKRDGAFLTKPTISAVPSAPVLGGHLTLACGNLDVDATYFWTKDNSIIAGQAEHKIQLDNLTSTDAGTYTCTVSESKVTFTSDAFVITAAQEIVKVSMLVLGLTLMMSKVFA